MLPSCFFFAEFPDISYDSYINKASPLEQYTQSTNFYSPVSDFCTDDNIPECILYLNQVTLRDRNPFTHLW